MILRQQYFRHAGEDVRLVRLHPDELRRGKARKDDIARKLTKARVRIEHGGFGVAARIVPQDAGPQHLVVTLEQCGAMHLA